MIKVGEMVTVTRHDAEWTCRAPAICLLMPYRLRLTPFGSNSAYLPSQSEVYRHYCHFLEVLLRSLLLLSIKNAVTACT
jgi:hypothetical protein